MKNPNSGYFYFGKGLGDALIKENKGSLNLSFYMFKNTTYFNGKVNIVYLNRLHNIYFPLRNKFNLVHFTDQTCRLKPYSVKAKKIMTIHDINNVHLKFKPQRKIDAHINKIRRYISYCDKVVTISQFVADDILKYIPEAREKLSVIYNGAEKLSVPDNHTPLYVPEKRFLFTIGLLSVQKGFHLIPALLEGNDYELVIAGIETPHKSTIVAEAEKYNCADRLTITGPVNENDKAWYYKNCSAFVFPSIAEGFGLPVIEAMHFGKPVFLAKYTSLPEVGGSVAYYFDNFESGHMQQVFKDGMLDYETNDRAAAIMQYAGKFSWESAARKYMALYNELLATK
ncbi:glycosyltransferase family 1 protein [Mucilaginibacter sp. AK015]|uniref:glycosyltransferase family 4 protein n=1 Tax=Mucilaginibacter sp. AK015 TaxID=2723072 RepID=UPI001614DE9C|nr:glycosyltransferase family 1 protein [Mucilaginibacter sp. AK015]MBB5397101.1 glycosyltransferase involved in cell wall biosynthesis [Mucilaginibacter sp. AK015]